MLLLNSGIGSFPTSAILPAKIEIITFVFLLIFGMVCSNSRTPPLAPVRTERWPTRFWEAIPKITGKSCQRYPRNDVKVRWCCRAAAAAAVDQWKRLKTIETKKQIPQRETPNRGKSMNNYVFHCFCNESLAKTRLKTFRQLR